MGRKLGRHNRPRIQLCPAQPPCCMARTLSLHSPAAISTLTQRRHRGFKVSVQIGQPHHARLVGAAARAPPATATALPLQLCAEGG